MILEVALVAGAIIPYPVVGMTALVGDMLAAAFVMMMPGGYRDSR